MIWPALDQLQRAAGPSTIVAPSSAAATLGGIVVQKVGGSSQIFYEPLPADDAACASPKSAERRLPLAWQPTISLEDGLDRTIAYFRKLLSA